jgi:hypothetical protein
LTSRAVQCRIQGPLERVKLAMKRYVSALAGAVVFGWSAVVFAQAAAPVTQCPKSFICAFSAAETLSLLTPKSQGTPGQSDVYAGYLSFDSSGSIVNMTGLQNINGTVQMIGGSTSQVVTGVCTNATIAGQPATITLNDGAGNTPGSIIAFVSNAANTELQFILSRDRTGPSGTSNNLRVGVCRQ